jgi:3-methyladenine DNA glycosylase/8-oxoguanine DNA glycosylase
MEVVSMADSIIWRDIEALAIFSICVANKPGDRTQRLVEELLAPCEIPGHPIRPFALIRGLIAHSDGNLERRLRGLRFGQYTKLTRALTELVNADLDLATCTTEELEAIHGVGPKTSRYFILRTRPGARVAALDTHILKWLRDRGYDAPKATPQSQKRYQQLEATFLAESDALHIDPDRLDAAIWETYSRRNS